MRTRLFAIVSGFILGGLLLAGYWDKAVFGWPGWYGDVFLVLAALGLVSLGWLFPRNWRAAGLGILLGLPLPVLGLGVPPTLGYVLVLGLADSEEFSGPGGWVELLGGPLLVLAIALILIWIGSWVSRRLSWPRAVGFLCLLSIAAMSATVIVRAYIREAHQEAQSDYDLAEYEHDLEVHKPDVIRKIPGLMQGVYQAEIAYNATRPDKAFTCNGGQLAKIPGLEWMFNTNSYSYYQIEPYTIGLYCAEGNRPHRFCLFALPSDRTRGDPAFWMDEKGKLVKGDATRKSPETACSVQ